MSVSLVVLAMFVSPRPRRPNRGRIRRRLSCVMCYLEATMRLSYLLALPLVASLGALMACLVELNPIASCGDGFVDKLAAEQCEPGDPSTYTQFCIDRGGVARDDSVCDPVRCVLVADNCDYCGNGKRDEGEECDGDDLGGVTCPGAAGVPSCNSDCTLDLSTCEACGNGQLDLDEECDPAMDPMDLAAQMPCTELVSPAGVSRVYGSGVSTRCTRKCLWDRSSCSYCQNEQLDGEVAVDFEGMIKLEPEVCDNGVAAIDRLHQHCKSVCGSNYDVECNYRCASNCRDFDVAAVPTDELECCTAAGEACPYDGEGKLQPGRRRCCREDDHPGEVPCETFIDDNQVQKYVCR